jgi:hypothetical protein
MTTTIMSSVVVDMFGSYEAAARRNIHHHRQEIILVGCRYRQSKGYALFNTDHVVSSARVPRAAAGAVNRRYPRGFANSPFARSPVSSHSKHSASGRLSLNGWAACSHSPSASPKARV